MTKVIYFIDGFNLYHSIVSIQNNTGEYLKWLDIASLCKAYLPALGNRVELVRINYFSALQKYLSISNPDKIQRHKLYIRCLEETGINVILGRFKEKDVYCTSCKQNIKKHEEKETDVSIAVKILEAFKLNECDLAVIITGDTDLTPVIHVSRRIFPEKEIIFIFPYDRENREIAKLLPKSFSIKSKSYKKYQLPDPFILQNGIKIFKPDHWKTPVV